MKATPKFPRREPTVALNADEEELFRNLELIIEENRDTGDFGRRAAQESIQAVLTYLLNRGLSGQAMVALVHIFDAFRDLEAGTQPELFDVTRVRDEGSEETLKWTRSLAGRQVKIFSAACMGALMKSGVAKNEAAAKVARNAVSWPRFSDGVIEPITVINWRDEFLQMGTSSPEKLRYDMLVAQFWRDGKPTSYLEEVLEEGPPLTFGRRRK